MPNQRRGHRRTRLLGGVEHVDGDQIVGIGHAHGGQCASVITAGGAVTPANTLSTILRLQHCLAG